MTPRIYYAGKLTAGRQVTLPGSAAAHVGKVLRLRAGDQLVLFSGDGSEHPSQIESMQRQRVVVSVGESRDPDTESPLRIVLLQGACRSHRMDVLIRKSTELGVSEVRPVLCERSVVRLDNERGRKKVEHWRQIAISACEQSGRVRIPAIRLPDNLHDAIGVNEPDVSTDLLLDPTTNDSLGDVLGNPNSVRLLIGPESGLTNAERQTAIDAGFVPVQLGPRILRTETAPLAAISLVQYLAGDLGSDDTRPEPL
jgi:16S rRNA (uracil1498-N3)-methyltransferase